MSDNSEFWREERKERQEKKERNRAASTEILRTKGISFQSKNGGVHLVVSHNGKVADFWPTTGKFIIRGGNSGRGIFTLINALVPSNKKENQ